MTHRVTSCYDLTAVHHAIACSKLPKIHSDCKNSNFLLLISQRNNHIQYREGDMHL